MAHMTFRTLLVHGEDAASNDGMVDELSRSGTLTNQACIRAFRVVDRGHFWVEDAGTTAYADMPVRHRKLHQSAPHIYARALEALMPLQPGVSFLNIGSGTGYFSSLVAELTGCESINDGIDIWPETIAHAQDRVHKLGRHAIEFYLGNVYELDVNLCMRYDRIYIGACASERAEYLYELLEVGGILVAPYQSGFSQQLRKVVRESEFKFNVEVLNSVHFAPLVEPSTSDSAPTSPAPLAPEGDQPLATGSSESGGPRTVGLPGIPFTFALRQRPWTLDRTWAYPDHFRAVVDAVLWASTRDHAQLCLPGELWQSQILPWCPRWWFQLAVVPPPSVSVRALSAIARAGITVKRALLRSRVPTDGHDLDELEHHDETASEIHSSAAIPTDDPNSAADPEFEDQGIGVLTSLLRRSRRHRGAPADDGDGPVPEQIGRVRRILRCVRRCCQVLPWDCLRWALRHATVWRGTQRDNTGSGGQATVATRAEDGPNFNML